MQSSSILPTLTPQEREQLLAKIGEDVLCPDELTALLAADNEGRVTCYDGFEPSGKIHIAQGIVKAINVNRLLKAGINCIFYVADWFAFLNNKCGADIAKIQTLGRYFIEVWKACGMLGVSSPVTFSSGRTASVRFVWASEFIRENSASYWKKVMSITRCFTVPRMQRCSTIMGRAEGDDQPISQIIYPSMQCADIFELGATVVEMGLDQRKVNVLAREHCEKVLELKGCKPVIIMHHMLSGLVGTGKMSKSVPGSAIYMNDSFEEIQHKIMNALCPEPGSEDANPILEYFRYIVFGAIEQGLISMAHPEPCVFIPYGPCAFLGDSEEARQATRFDSHEELEAAYNDGSIQPDTLKSSLVHYVDNLVAPIRAHFESTAELARLFSEVCAIQTAQ